MAEEALTITVPSALAKELDATTQEFLIELLERGLRALKIERVLDVTPKGECPWVRRHIRQGSPNQNWPAMHTHAGWPPPLARRPGLRN